MIDTCNHLVAGSAPVILGLVIGFTVAAAVAFVRLLWRLGDLTVDQAKAHMVSVPPGTPPGAIMHLEPGQRLRWPLEPVRGADPMADPPTWGNRLMATRAKMKDCPNCRSLDVSERLTTDHAAIFKCGYCGHRWGRDD